MNHQDLQTLVDYHYWARDRVLDAVAPISQEDFLRDRGNSFKSIRDTLAHIYFAEWVWYARWHGESPTALPDAGRFPTLDSLRAAWTELEGKVRTFVDSLSEADLRRSIDYRLFNGTAGASQIWHMVQHVVNHATYHRGQVTTMLRQAGMAPPKSLDLITFYRERSARSA